MVYKMFKLVFLKKGMFLLTMDNNYSEIFKKLQLEQKGIYNIINKYQSTFLYMWHFLKYSP